MDLVIENALEKGCKLWLVLQNIQKTYNSLKDIRAYVITILTLDLLSKLTD
ncbi:hypothetical protein G9A89_002373 [Geosiphon pyriformis]|nr:hypothetical protein G9A89_002373 [Geosiphon pyriformis]